MAHAVCTVPHDGLACSHTSEKYHGPPAHHLSQLKSYSRDFQQQITATVQCNVDRELKQHELQWPLPYILRNRITGGGLLYTSTRKSKEVKDEPDMTTIFTQKGFFTFMQVRLHKHCQA